MEDLIGSMALATGGSGSAAQGADGLPDVTAGSVGPHTATLTAGCHLSITAASPGAGLAEPMTLVTLS